MGLAPPDEGREERQERLVALSAHRDFPLNPQETTTYSNPVFEGSRLYIRGERHLYCIGEKWRETP